MRKIEIYTRQGCGYCSAARSLLNKLGVEFVEFDLTGRDEAVAQLMERTGMRTVPQVFIDDELIGGYEELSKLVESRRSA